MGICLSLLKDLVIHYEIFGQRGGLVWSRDARQTELAKAAASKTLGSLLNFASRKVARKRAQDMMFKIFFACG